MKGPSARKLLRRIVAVLATVAIASSDDPLTLLAAWLLAGFAERRLDGRASSRVGDAAMVVVVVLVLAGVSTGLAAVALAVAVASRIGAFPFRPPDATSALTTSLGGIAAVLHLGPAVGGEGMVAALLGVSALTTAALAARAAPDGRAIRLVAASGIVVVALTATIGATGAAIDLGSAVLLGIGLLLLTERFDAPARWRRLTVWIGAATLAGFPPLAGFRPAVSLLTVMRPEYPAPVALLVGVQALTALAVVRIAMRVPEAPRPRRSLAIGAGAALAFVAVLLGCLGWPGTGLPVLSIVVVLVASATGLCGALALRDRPGRSDDSGAEATDRARLALLGALARLPVRTNRLLDGAFDRLARIVGSSPGLDARGALVALLVLLALAVGLIYLAPELGGIVGCSPR